MREVSQNPLSQPAVIFLYGALTAAALLGNVFSLPLFFGVDFLFGSIATLIVAALFGFWPAIATAIVASAYTYVLWNIPWAIVIFTCEAAFIAALYRRKSNNLLILAGVYWLLIGMPLVWLFYRYVIGMDLSGVVLIMLKQSVNGIFNAMLAGALLVALQRWRSMPGAVRSPTVPLRDSLFLLVAAAVFLPSLGLTVLESRREIHAVEEVAEDRLHRNSINISHHIQRWHDVRRQLLAWFLEATYDPGAEAQSVLAERAGFLRQRHPEFLQIALLDGEGEILFVSPSADRDGDAPPLFRVDGDGGILISHGPSGSDERTAIAIVDPSSLRRVLIDQTFGQDKYAIVSLSGSLVAGGDFHLAEPSFLLDADRVRPPISSAGQIHWIEPEETGGARMTRWRRSYYAQRTTIAAGEQTFPLVMAVPIRPFQDRLYKNYIENLLVAFFLAYLAIVAAGFISRRAVVPIERLARITSDIPERLSGPTQTEWPESEFTEIAVLLKNFQVMAASLRESFDSLITQQKELEAEVAERRQAEKALRGAEEKLRRHAEELEARVATRTFQLQESVESLEGFCYTIAHDLRAPLRSIQGLASILVAEHGGALSEEGRDYTERIKNSATRMDHLLCDLLEYGRLAHQDLPISNVDLETAVQQAVTAIAGDASRLRVAIEVERPLHAVFGNPTILGQALANLFSNALKYGCTNERPRIRIWSEARERKVRLFMADNGPGIDPAYQEKIFGLFERLDGNTSHSGTGIGLAIVRKGIERIHGRAGVNSTPGQGAAFWIELPMGDKADPPKRETAALPPLS